MITAIITGFINLTSFLISLLPVFSVRLPSDVKNLVSNVFHGVGYFVPNSVWTILGITLTYYAGVFAYNSFVAMRDWVPFY